MGTKQYFEEKIGKLGYGNMRLPKIDGKPDMATINGMIDRFMAAGYSYFDTAYIYEGSEAVLHEALVKRFPREKFQIATKIAMMTIRDPKEMRSQVDTSLRRLGVDYIDFYLLHGLNGEFIKRADEYDAWGFLRGLKEQGIAKHIGFSFHGTPEELEMLLDKHDYIELVQLQINYLDWENPTVQSRRLYEIARSHDTPISIMEPNKGGWLAGETSDAGLLMKSVNPSASVASWAFRYLMELEGVAVILSGVGTISEIEDNIKTFNENKPLTAQERDIIKQAVDIFNAAPTVPCTSCFYCMPHCPQKIAIPTFLGMYSNYRIYKNPDTLRHTYSMFGGQAKLCVSCGACEKVCPQHLEISKYMADIAKLAEEQ